MQFSPTISSLNQLNPFYARYVGFLPGLEHIKHADVIVATGSVLFLRHTNISPSQDGSFRSPILV